MEELTFNRHQHLSAYKSINAHLDELTSSKKKLLEFIKFLLVSCNNVSQKSDEVHTAIHILAKLRFTLESTIFLMSEIKDDYRFKVSLNVLYRSILGDIIGSLYLLTFFDFSNDEQPYIAVELNLSHMEFLKSVIKIIDAEKHFKDYSSESESYMDEVIDANPELFNFPSKSWKSIDQMRDAVDDKFPIDIRLKKPTETNKIDHLHSKGIIDGPRMLVAFKYLSQYQHFTPKMHDFLLSDISGDIEYYEMTLEFLIVNCSHLMNILTLNNKEQLLAQLTDVISDFKAFLENRGTSNE